MTERIVITGLGAVSPMGSCRATISDNFRNYRSALTEWEICPGFTLWFGRVQDDPLELAGDMLDFLSPVERKAAMEDNSVWFAMSAVRQAISESHIDLSSYAADRIGVVLGSSKGQLRSLLQAHHYLRDNGVAAAQADGGYLGHLVHNFGGEFVGEILARRFQIEGPVLNYPAACATGLNAVIYSMQLLLDGTLDVVISGSSESAGNAVSLASFLNMGALAPGHVRPFHKDRHGFNPGEGAGVFILERESDARARGAKILGRICGWDFRSDAHHITAVEPGGTVIEHAIRRTLERAEWDPATVEYINAHGTGTEINDRTEAGAIDRVFGGEAGPYVSSVKSYIGHLLGASSGVELALIMTTLADGFVPPTLLLDEPDPEFHLKFVPSEGLNKYVHRYMKFSYGFGGHIAILAMEQEVPANA